jgi:hypothetical protein
MRKFIRNSLLFLVILLGINTIIYFVGKSLYFGNYSNVSLKYHSYLLADSHGLPLKSLTEKYGVYNFSAGSDSYFDMHRKLVYLINNTRVDTIYITADDHTLGQYRESNNNSDRSVIYSLPNQFDNYYDYIKERYIKYYLPLFQPKLRYVIRSYMGSKLTSVARSVLSSSKNKQLTWMLLSSDEKIKLSRNRAHTQFPDDKNSVNLEQDLTEIIKLCKQNNIELIGVKLPLTTEYGKITANKSYGADSVIKLNGYKVLDYSKSYAGNSEYFADPDHLNETGGRYFVNLLFEDTKVFERVSE